MTSPAAAGAAGVLDLSAAGTTAPQEPDARPVRPKRVRMRNRPGYLLALPVAIVLALGFLYPVLRMVWTSITTPAGDLTFERYARLLSDPFYLDMVWRTIRISLITTVVSLLLAYPVAMHMRQMSARGRAFLSLILLSPLLISVVVRTLGWVILLSPTGVVNTALDGLGLGPFELIYNELAVVLGMTHVFFGYMTLSLMISVLGIPDHLLLAASDLGAKRRQILRHIIVPLSMPGVRAGCILVFALSASAYITPALLGGGRDPLLAQRVYDSALFYADFPEAAAFATILLVLILVGMFLIAFATRTSAERRGSTGTHR
jgi:putative spermidine/putrescine transport system permease protein